MKLGSDRQSPHSIERQGDRSSTVLVSASRGLLVWLLITLLILPSMTFGRGGSESSATSPSEGTGRIRGKISKADGNSPVAGAVVTAFHLETGGGFASKPTGGDGEFEITGVPFGYVDIAVDSAGGVFVGSEVVNVPPAGKVVVRLILTPYADRSPAWRSEGERREIVPLGKPSTGSAEMRTRMTGREFWKSSWGIAIIGGGAGALLLAIAAGGGGSPASPSSP